MKKIQKITAHVRIAAGKGQKYRERWRVSDIETGKCATHSTSTSALYLRIVHTSFGSEMVACGGSISMMSGVARYGRRHLDVLVHFYITQGSALPIGCSGLSEQRINIETLPRLHFFPCL